MGSVMNIDFFIDNMDSILTVLVTILTIFLFFLQMRLHYFRQKKKYLEKIVGVSYRLEEIKQYTDIEQREFLKSISLFKGLKFSECLSVLQINKGARLKAEQFERIIYLKCLDLVELINEPKVEIIKKFDDNALICKSYNVFKFSYLLSFFIYIFFFMFFLSETKLASESYFYYVAIVFFITVFEIPMLIFMNKRKQIEWFKLNEKDFSKYIHPLNENPIENRIDKVMIPSLLRQAKGYYRVI